MVEYEITGIFSGDFGDFMQYREVGTDAIHQMSMKSYKLQLDSGEIQVEGSDE